MRDRGRNKEKDRESVVHFKEQEVTTEDEDGISRNVSQGYDYGNCLLGSCKSSST